MIVISDDEVSSFISGWPITYIFNAPQNFAFRNNRTNVLCI